MPTISDNSSCEILSSMRMLRGSFLPMVRASCNKRLAQPLFAIDRHQVGDDLLLVGNAHRQVAHETFE